MPESISVALLLRENARSTQCIEKAKAAALAIGLTPTSEGAATICCRVSLEGFRQLFGNALEHVKERSASSSDHGASAGFVAENLPVDASLREWVEHISVLPPAIRMHDRL